MTDSSPAILEVDDLTVEYNVGSRKPPLRAVDGVSLTIAPKETLGLVGESGSGKSTIGRAVLGLVGVTGGSVRFAGRDITHASYKERRQLSALLQVVFQDPYSSLNPARTIGQTLSESLRPHRLADKSEAAARVVSMLERVGLPADAAARYPAQFSGGQRQRVAIARALMVSPRLVICDEPVSSLDKSVQAQVLNLLRELQEALQLSYLFISHDLAVVRHVSHRTVVLYRGRVMEYGRATDVYERPNHPYTEALLGAAPLPDPVEQRKRQASRARTSSTASLTSAGVTSCYFAPRCPHVAEICWRQRPKLERTFDDGLVACHRWRELSGQPPPVTSAPSAATAGLV
jgi:oligopeptide/dipeptide ABC transporter ATP-binding protein